MQIHTALPEYELGCNVKILSSDKRKVSLKTGHHAMYLTGSKSIQYFPFEVIVLPGII